MGATFGLGLARITDWEASTTQKVETIAEFAKLGYLTPFYEVIDGLVFRFDGAEVSELSSSALGAAIAAFQEEHEFGGGLSYDAWSYVDASIVPFETTDLFREEFVRKYHLNVPFGSHDNHSLGSFGGVVDGAIEYVRENEPGGTHSAQLTDLMDYLDPIEAFCQEHGVNLVVSIWG